MGTLFSINNLGSLVAVYIFLVGFTEEVPWASLEMPLESLIYQVICSGSNTWAIPCQKRLIKQILSVRFLEVKVTKTLSSSMTYFVKQRAVRKLLPTFEL